MFSSGSLTRQLNNPIAMFDCQRVKLHINATSTLKIGWNNNYRTPFLFDRMNHGENSATDHTSWTHHGFPKAPLTQWIKSQPVPPLTGNGATPQATWNRWICNATPTDVRRRSGFVAKKTAQMAIQWWYLGMFIMVIQSQSDILGVPTFNQIRIWIDLNQLQRTYPQVNQCADSYIITSSFQFFFEAFITNPCIRGVGSSPD